MPAIIFVLIAVVFLIVFREEIGYHWKKRADQRRGRRSDTAHIAGMQDHIYNPNPYQPVAQQRSDRTGYREYPYLQPTHPHRNPGETYEALFDPVNQEPYRDEDDVDGLPHYYD